MAEVTGQIKINFTDLDPRSLPPEVLKGLRVIPIGTRVLESTGRGDYKPVGFVAPKKDEQPDIEGETILKGGYYIQEHGVPTKGKIGRYAALVRINLRAGEKTLLNPNTIFLANKSSIIKPTDQITRILAERGIK